MRGFDHDVEFLSDEFLGLWQESPPGRRHEVVYAKLVDSYPSISSVEHPIWEEAAGTVAEVADVCHVCGDVEGDVAPLQLDPNE